MTARTAADIATLIRELDHDGDLSPYDLGGELAGTFELVGFGILCRDMGAFVQRINPDKKLSPEQLATVIVAEFNLDEETR
ncbi:hypothetical protein [Paractinoplanes maris]|uniref:hypothetical protein n=1 Tax=Paractinoplanes maris TaxID=1734446 RepID=UPI0020222369|nr:hypothetical protein [Actinoplanes maris]